MLNALLAAQASTAGKVPHESDIIERLRNGLDALGAEWVLWLLFLLSAISIAFMVERWLYYRKRHIDAGELGEALDKDVEGGEWDKVTQKLSPYSGAMEVDIALRLINSRHRSIAALEDLKAAATETSRLEYERRLGFLATVGSNAPFVGLFGTVIGIIAAFADLEAAYTVAAANMNKTQLIMGSISEALVATAVGLLVAIPAVAAYNSFQRRVDQSVTAAEVLARQVMARIREEK